jgi:RNA polymerase sigma-70 factor (ECF subfamily)
VALPLDLREAVILAFVVGMPLAEVAQVQGVPVGTVKSRLHTARQRLKAVLADSYPERASARGLGGRLPDGAASS